MKLPFSAIAAVSWALTMAAAAQAASVPAPAPSHEPPPANRIASLYVSEGFVNEQLREHVKSDLVSDLKLVLNPDDGQLYLRGIVIVPVEELRAINLDPKLGKFRFQVAAKLSVSHRGHLILDFPLNETFFYPADSKDPVRDRVIVPVQMLSIALASARGYLAALSGDFSEFDRRTKKTEALLKSTDHEISLEKNADALEELRTQRESLRIQLSAIPVERKQLENMSKQLSSVLGFTGEKELDLNDELKARENALALKINLGQLIPYLQGVDLGGIRILRDKKDGAGQNYLVIDVNSALAAPTMPPHPRAPSDRPPMKTPPDLVIRMNQALFASEAVVGAEDKEMGSKIQDLDLELRDDGLHVTGKAHMLLVITIPFETVVDFVSTGLDTFEIRVREMKVAGVDFDFLAKTILESMKRRLNHSLKGICKFHYVGDESHSHVLRVTVDPKALVPAFPGLHLVGVDIRPGEFLMKIGRP